MNTHDMRTKDPARSLKKGINNNIQTANLPRIWQEIFCSVAPFCSSLLGVPERDDPAGKYVNIKMGSGSKRR